MQTGRPLEVYRPPANTFVARFLGNPPMKLLPARTEAGRSAWAGLASASARPARVAAR